ncbi:hydrolase 1, exosortase A system-associated [Aurantiacibacter spongiae]|uniref:Hydrolase 1, exosortase A system-associated n=1 Tax=Aurantiacibacter spongiae TaxID=2488860 RepID=A0A3N5CJW7_9SPHN|nr:hydrolase 1, exosortase A system-associated [Aurantiacibacter spongiae]RPF68836.1 hydrolase 1, exosortase A system-associated [Aurantiacibacter spongiae]
MTRRFVSFPCEDETLVATLDEAEGASGLLILGGGNEVRSGPFGSLSRLAARVARSGYPVWRFDRRGVGDSSGDNCGFRDAGADLGAAIRAFRREAPRVRRVVAFGNCDAASALMLVSGGGCDALVLANPWTFESDDAALPPAAIRARYSEKLRNPRELARLVTGGVSYASLLRGMVAALRPPPPPTPLIEDMAAGLARYHGAVEILLAGRDRTAQAFARSWPENDDRIMKREQADHAFSAPEDADWLAERLLVVLHEQARQLDMG